MSRSKIITELFLNSLTYKTCDTIHIYKSLPDEVDTQYIIKYAIREGKQLFYPTPDWKDNEKCDLVICPGRKFDKRMTRHGRGKGYYDRYLHHTPSLRIGICYEEQMFDEIPRKDHDIPMDLVITEAGIYNRRTLIKKGDNH